MLNHLARYPLAHLPTPLEALPRLSAALGGPRLYIKRDDQTGLATGGNKTRKLEFLLAEAQAHGADTLLTVGAPQSNHCRQTAAAAAKAGLRCALVLGGNPPATVTGNILLDHLLGAEIHYAGAQTREAKFAEVLAAEQAAGHTVYPVPLGGSTPLGAVSYANAMLELAAQARALDLAFDRIVFASSSAGTHAGLVVGATMAGLSGEVLGVSVDHPRDVLRGMVAHLATQTAQLLGQPHQYHLSDIAVNADYLGGGYAALGAPEREAIELFARHEGVLLDPVYTGRAAAGLIDLIRKGTIGAGETALFWHTGGMPALWAYARELAQPNK
jgi:D-cysteine desulfhydrase family pyridoxal phosphate-dependent enzyme